MSKRIHVVAAVIRDASDNIFIAKRPTDKHQGGLWEFPGGKVETDESPLQALKRELHEEIGIGVIDARPLIKISHDYPDKSVLLDVWEVSRFEGIAHGKENQETCWVKPDELDHYDFPAANKPIVTAAQLPSSYAITQEPEDTEAFYQTLQNVLAQGIKLLQLRFKKTPASHIIEKSVALANQHSAQIVLNCPDDISDAKRTHGRHLTSSQLMSCEERPVSHNYWLAASCHNEEEIARAEQIGVDFIVLAPVKETSSHPDAPTLGWEKFESLTYKCTVPVYALGGIIKEDLAKAQASGAQGIAGISVFLP